MNKLQNCLAAIAAASILAGCASIVAGTSQVVSINSNVSGASVSINGGTVGVTPFTGSIPRGKDTTVTVSKAGYQTQTITLSTKIEPIFFGNIIFGGLIGSTTDLATGALFEYAPSSYYVNLIAGTTMNQQQFIRDTELKFYVMTNAAAIRDELVAGNGEHIDSLHRAFFAGIDKASLLSELRAIAANSGRDTVALGEKVAALSN
jgi:hypothetical protein